MTADVAIIGGGIIGCSIAYSLAREGLSVALFERDELAAHASGAAAGMLAPLCESEGAGPLFEWGLRALDGMALLATELKELSGVDPQFVPSGVLRVALSSVEAAHLQSSARALAPQGLEWIDADAARQREPHLSRKALGALWSPREGHVYSPQFTRAYALAASRLGARLEQGVPSLGLLRDGDRVIGIRTARGEIGAGHVVLCAGVWSRFCGPWLGTGWHEEDLPIDPVRGQILALDSPQPSLRSIVWSSEVYLVPKLDGSVVVGATEEHAGYDCRTTAAGLAYLLNAAPRAIPALSSSSLRRAWAGLRPATADHLPIIGPVPGVEGLTLATGHYRNGVLLSSITGSLVADWIVRHDFPVAARPFLPERLVRCPTAVRTHR